VILARRGIAALLYLTAGVAAVIDPSSVGLALATGSVVLLTVGYRFKGEFTMMVSGWLLYLPLAVAFAPVLGPFWGYLASGTYLAVITERLGFETQVSFAIEASAGVDAEGKRLAQELSARHLRRLAMVIVLVVAIAGLSLAASVVLSAVSVLILASVMLLVAVGVYATRPAARRTRFGQEA
jgi:hypothetical protein